MFTLIEIWLLLSFAVAWAGIVAAVVRDAHARVENPSAARAAAALAALLPIVGGALWLCVRPSETRLQRRERRLVLSAYAWDEPRTVQPPVSATAAPELQQVAA
jgi:hypothetical protein